VSKIRKDYCMDCGIELIGDQGQYAQCKTCYDAMIYSIESKREEMAALEASMERRMRLNEILTNVFAIFVTIVLAIIFAIVLNILPDNNIALAFSGVFIILLIYIMFWLERC